MYPVIFKTGIFELHSWGVAFTLSSMNKIELKEKNVIKQQYKGPGSE